MGVTTDIKTAVSRHICNGQCVYLGGFTHLIPFAAGHEIIRQEVTDLHLARATPDLIYDRMIAAGCASKLTFSYAGNPGVGSLNALRRAIEDEVPNPFTLDEYSHFGLVSRLEAGASNLPFLPLRTFAGSDLPAHNPNIRPVENPFADGVGTEEELFAVPPLNPDVAVVRAQRADSDGNAHLWGIQGEMVEAAFAADTVILSVEEIVDAEVIGSDPNRCAIPGNIIDAVVEEPYGSHPSYAHGYYDRDNEAYLAWAEASQTHESTLEWLDEWVYGVDNHDEYLAKLGVERLADLRPGSAYSAPINVGRYA